MSTTYRHYLSYGATDQQTARLLRADYDGLLVPGTIAAFQAEGTKGFVLTVTAGGRPSPAYTIDPRFPLFQQRLSTPKKSHEALALVFGDPDLVQTDKDPIPADFDGTRIRAIATAWLEFNAGYTTVSSKHFKKYADRLGEEILPESKRSPEFVLPPYVVAEGAADPWWAVSEALWAASSLAADALGLGQKLVRVVATKNTESVGEMMSLTEETHLAVWCSALNELDTSAEGQRALEQYAEAIKDCTAKGKRIFALYGGFFSVLLAPLGLRGASHGIGYGESRAWEELPQSGPPPVRYYLPRAHRYISMDLALFLWRERPELVVCDCQECERRSPAGLDYHALMRHSVRSRANEIRDWLGRSSLEASEELERESTQFRDAFKVMLMPGNLRRQAEQCYIHLETWAEVLRAVAT